ncbi:hypothetical protein M885DRAFT_565127 [Pelagophyceae sp. CCMP2097]|nr:hypothetical protein M885DRAFT_565127 [Pelagophyceae sp. CCMP2097]
MRWARLLTLAVGAAAVDRQDAALAAAPTLDGSVAEVLPMDVPTPTDVPAPPIEAPSKEAPLEAQSNASAPPASPRLSAEVAERPHASLRLVIVGAGRVALALAQNLARKGVFQSVSIAARNVSKAEEACTTRNLTNVPVVPLANGVDAADVLILCTASMHDDGDVRALASMLGACAGKVIIDATNPLDSSMAVRWAAGTSSAEVLQGLLPQALLFKAFNTLTTHYMADGRGADHFFCGAAAARDVATAVVEAVGLTPRYVGGIRYARNLEAIAELLIHTQAGFLPGEPLPAGGFLAWNARPSDTLVES